MDAITNFIGGLIAAPFACIGWIIVGFIAGALARRIMGSNDAGCVSDIVLGLIGAFLGGFIVGLLGFRQTLDIGLGIGTTITALIGAIVVIAISRVFMPRRGRR